jgi:adenylyltransferase/sulfurtransferase
LEWLIHIVMDYSRQEMVIGKGGQENLKGKTALLVGVGGIGTLTAEYAVRAGINLRLVDHDKVEWSNLQRQVLFDSDDVNKYKADVAKTKLQKVNPDVKVEGVKTRFSDSNAAELCKGVDIILDGTDNLKTRFAMNKAGVGLGIPYIYTACAGTVGAVALLGGKPCLNCFLSKDKRGLSAREIGVLGPTAGLVASIQSYLAINCLAGKKVVSGKLYNCSMRDGVTATSINADRFCKVCGNAKG